MVNFILESMKKNNINQDFEFEMQRKFLKRIGCYSDDTLEFQEFCKILTPDMKLLNQRANVSGFSRVMFLVFN
jgi:hypothetical protein